jgi:hypothetical protein
MALDYNMHSSKLVLGTLKNQINEIIIIIVNGNLYCALFTRCIIRAGWAQGLIKKA